MNSYKIILVFIFFIFSIPVASQMPDWKYFKDQDNNTYYIDRNNKIYPSGKPDFKFKPVSIDGLDYYFTQGKDLIKSGYKVNGLTLLKSILIIPSDNDLIYNYQIKTANYINSFQRKEGERFSQYNRKSSILMYKEKNKIYLKNDLMFYSMSMPGRVDIIRKRERDRNNYIYDSLTLGSSFNMTDKKGYDIIIAIDSEKFNYPILNIETYIKSLRIKLGKDQLRRNLLYKEKYKILYQYESKSSKIYSGFEYIIINRFYGYIIRIITPKEKFKLHEKKIRNIIDKIKFIRGIIQ
jgi:hypothetical protein